ncbi:MAG TPA: hypothetical protein VMU22_06935 [Rhizomicrobium sp.]|nr:hypothetical protein [Rhizomicrobium sp.]
MTTLGFETMPPRAVALPRDEMAFRALYRPLLLSRALTTVFRPGDRIYPKWRGYSEGETVTARIIRRPGSDELGVPPEFDDMRIPIRIRSISVSPIDALGRDAFQGSSPDVHDLASLATHLRHIYGRPIAAFGNLVTRIAFSYLG